MIPAGQQNEAEIQTQSRQTRTLDLNPGVAKGGSVKPHCNSKHKIITYRLLHRNVKDEKYAHTHVSLLQEKILKSTDVLLVYL